MEFGTEFARALGHLLIQVSPYFLLGAVFAAVLKTYELLAKLQERAIMNASARRSGRLFG